MTRIQARRCRAGFDTDVPIWIRDELRPTKLPRNFDQCRRQQGHPKPGGHTPDCGGAYDDDGNEIHQNSWFWFATHVEDWRNGLNIWGNREYIQDIKDEIQRLVNE